MHAEVVNASWAWCGECNMDDPYRCDECNMDEFWVRCGECNTDDPYESERAAQEAVDEHNFENHGA